MEYLALDDLAAVSDDNRLHRRVTCRAHAACTHAARIAQGKQKLSMAGKGNMHGVRAAPLAAGKHRS